MSLDLDEVEDEVSSFGEGEGGVGLEEKSVEVLRGRKREKKEEIRARSAYVRGKKKKKERNERTDLLVEPPSKSPVQPPPGFDPPHLLSATLGLHSTDPVVKIGVEVGDLHVGRLEVGLSLLEKLSGLGSLLGRLRRVVRSGLERSVGLVESSHDGGDLVPSELDLNDTLGFW